MPRYEIKAWLTVKADNEEDALSQAYAIALRLGGDADLSIEGEGAIYEDEDWEDDRDAPDEHDACPEHEVAYRICGCAVPAAFVPITTKED